MGKQKSQESSNEFCEVRYVYLLRLLIIPKTEYVERVQSNISYSNIFFFDHNLSYCDVFEDVFQYTLPSKVKVKPVFSRLTRKKDSNKKIFCLFA